MGRRFFSFLAFYHQITDSDQVWEKLVEALFPVVLRFLWVRIDDRAVDVGASVDIGGVYAGGQEELVEDVFADNRWIGNYVFEGAVSGGDFNLQLGLNVRIELYVASGIQIVRFLGGRNLLDLEDSVVGMGVDESGRAGGADVPVVQKRQHAVAAVSKAAACRPLSTAIGRPWSCC